MGKPTGFLEVERRENPWRPETERVRDFAAMHGALSESERMRQASRCMNCGVPYCQSDYGCPLHNLIPEWNDLLYRGNERDALGRLLKTSPFPEFTGRVCPALCEKACMMAETDGASTNRDNELYLIEEGFRRGWIGPRPPKQRTGRRIAIAGSGPAGLGAADRLNRLGHSVTVYERASLPGGLLMFGIPNMKLPKDIVARRIRLMEAEGIRFIAGQEASPDVTQGYDAVLLCGGARKPRPLAVPGSDMPGVHYAVDYLSAATEALLKGSAPAIDAKNRDVIVLGGGDTGNDCVGTALRQGCKSLIELELLKAPPERRSAGNPWPEWPRVLRTDYGQTEAANIFGADPRLFESTVTALHSDEYGRLCAATVSRVRRNDDGSIVPVAGSERTFSCRLLLIAAGFIGCDPYTAGAYSLSLTPRGTPDGMRGHNIRGNLFAAGDLRSGQSLVVRAIADGIAAANEADAYLKR